MLKVTVTMDVRGKAMALDAIPDARVRDALEGMARDIGKKLESAQCPTHHQAPTDVRVHVNAAGDADLKYGSCCEKLKDVVSKAL